MKIPFLLVTIVAVVCATNIETFLTQDGHYITDFNNFDFNEVLKLDRLLKAYIACLKSDGSKCKTKEQRFIKGMYD